MPARLSNYAVIRELITYSTVGNTTYQCITDHFVAEKFRFCSLEGKRVLFIAYPWQANLLQLIFALRKKSNFSHSAAFGYL